MNIFKYSGHIKTSLFISALLLVLLKNVSLQNQHAYHHEASQIIYITIMILWLFIIIFWLDYIVHDIIKHYKILF